MEAQEQLLVDYCARQNLEVVDKLSIAETASKYTHRKKFHRYLRWAINQGVCHIVVEKVDRLTRSGNRDAVLIDDWIEGSDKRHVHFVKQSLDIHKHAHSTAKFVWNMQVAVAKHTTDNLSEEVRKTANHMLEQGIWPTAAPLGYIRDKTNLASPIQFDTAKAPLVRRLFELYDTGDWPLQSLVDEAAKMGLRNKFDRPISQSRLHRMLTDNFYIGLMVYRKKTWQGAHEPLVSVALFKRVEKQMRRKLIGRGANLRHRHKHLFARIALCAGCGYPLTWELHGPHTYGYCRGYHGCILRPAWRQDRIEAAVIDAMAALHVIDGKLDQWLRKCLSLEYESLNTALDHQKSVLLSTQGDLESKLMVLLEMRLGGEIGRAEYEEKKSALDVGRLQAVSQLKTLEAEFGEGHKTMADLYDTVQRFFDLYQHSEASAKRSMVRDIVHRIDVSDTTVKVTLKSHYAKLAESVRRAKVSKKSKSG